jgi:small subunit ribosomal protein S17
MTANETTVESKAGRRTREGLVISTKMEKTIVVEITRTVEHPQFKKIIKRKVKYAVHDENKEAKMGDRVRIEETRPLSKTKRWRLVQVISK